MYYIKIIDKPGFVEHVEWKVYKKCPDKDALNFMRAFHTSVEIGTPNKKWFKEEEKRLEKRIENLNILLIDVKARLKIG